MIAHPYQDLFPHIDDAIHEKWNTEWKEKNDNFKEIKPDTPPWKENTIFRKDETVVYKLKAGHTLLTHGYLIEGLLVPKCELCHSHAMTVKYFLAECPNLASLRLKIFDCSNLNTLKQILGINKVNSNTIKLLKEINIYN